MPTSQVLFSQRMYDARSSNYDSSWHPIHALNYIKWTQPQPGQRILDLACGTGLVSLPAKRTVGPDGTVTAVDVSTGMMAVGKEKARKEGLEIEWVEWDIGDLDNAQKQGKIGEDYDIITCSSALVLLQDPGRAIRQWVGLLKKDGKIITDVPTENTMIEGLAFEEVGLELGIELPGRRCWVTGLKSLKRLFEDAGLEIVRAWEADGYDGSAQYKGGTAGESFGKCIKSEAWAAFGKDGVREKAREAFVRRVEARMAGDRVVREEDAFYVVVGRKV
ncbi:hypothetical protein MMC28_009287 [Mycoblastus sanguinarius]|nr:hypothetical protein [Mycoblastus sanguinarius]